MEHRHTPHNIIEYTPANIFVTALERQVSGGDIDGEVADHYWNIAYDSKECK